jgi:hypothetical protein
MEKSEFKGFLSIMNRAAIAFDVELSEQRQKVYWDIFKQYSVGEFSGAMNQVVRSCKFFPKPAEILEFMGGNVSLHDEATKEAMLVIEAMRRIGGYSTVKFSNPATNAVVMQGFGGWQKLCDESTEENNKWLIKDFVNIYKSYRASHIEQHTALPGIIQTENEGLGYEYDGNVVLISDLLLRDNKQIEQENVKMIGAT